MVLSKGSTRKHGLIIATTGALLALGVTSVGSMPAFANTTTAVVPQSPTHVEVCGPNNDTVTTPGSQYNNDPQVTVTTEFVYVIDPHGTDAHTPGIITVAALPNVGFTVSQPGSGDNSYVIENSGHALWTFTDANTPCTPPVTHVTATAPTYTPGTCSAMGTVVAPNTAQYTWATSGTTAATYKTASAVGNVVLDGQKVFGPYDLSMLSGQACATAPPVTTYDSVLWQTHTYNQKYSQDKITVTNVNSITLPTIPTTCGTSWQGDVYIHSDAESAWLSATTSLAGPDGAQDGSYLAPGGNGVAYIYVINPPCVTPPTTVACVATPGWKTEDVAPGQTAEGLLFAGASVPAINTFQRVSAGNMQGLTGMTVTYAAGATGQPAQVKVEVNPNAVLNSGGPILHYITLTSNLAAGTSGTINVQNLATWSSTRILAGPGSQGNPITWAAMTALMPDNMLLSAPSLGLTSKSSAGDRSVVESISSSCGSASFVPTKPANVVTTNPVTTTSCKANTSTTVTTTTTKPFVWNADSKSYVLSTDSADWTVTDDSPGVTVALTSSQIAERCPSNVVVPVEPSYSESCTITDVSIVDAKTEGIKYTAVLTGNTVVTTAVAVAPFVIKDGAKSSWTHTFTGAAATSCNPPTTTGHTLAFTGSNWPWMLVLVGALAAVLIGILVKFALYRRRKQHVVG